MIVAYVVIGMFIGLFAGMIFAAWVETDRTGELYKAFCTQCQKQNKRSQAFCEITCDIWERKQKFMDGE